MPAADLYAGDYSAPRPDINTFTFSNRSKSEATTKEAYALTKAGFFSDHVFLMGGVTRVWVDSVSYSFNPTTLAPATYSTLSGFKDSYLGSFLVKPTAHTSLYYSYSTNANLTAFNPGNGVTIPLWSQGRQHEFGAKTEFLDQRLSFTVDHFQIAQTNVTTPNPLANVNPSAAGNILTDNTSRGFEANVVGGITKDLSVIASFTNMKYRDAFGRRVRNVPDNMANLLLNYHVRGGPLANLNVFAAVEQSGQVAGETVTGATKLGVPELPGFYIAAWHAVNAGANYRIGHYRFALNIDNVLNSRFAWEPASRLSVSPYPGITFRFSTRVMF
jgi:iron complex outermembrane receptor protein